jgi:glutathione synthase/RimK-type ligase-like ATP-grasp enzyme
MKKTILKNKNIVAKSLTSGLITTDKDLFTTEVNLEKLDLNYPWYLQEKIEATDDITTFICGDNLFTFSRNRKELVGLDWRNQNDFFDDDQKWVPYELTKKEMNSIRSFAKKIRVECGRIDFLKSNDELIFLEYNANGQFFFLDTKNQYGLKDAVVEYLRK